MAYVILVSAKGPNPSFFFNWGTFIQLGGLLGQGLGLRLRPGLDNFRFALVKFRAPSFLDILIFMEIPWDLL